MPNSYTFSALVLGASGQAGRSIVRELSEHPRIPKVTLLVRKALELPQPQPPPPSTTPTSEDPTKPPPPPPPTTSTTKIIQHIIDFDKLPEYSDLFLDHDVVFCALGTHSSLVSDRELFYKVDHHYVLDCAKLSKLGGCHHFVVITMKGADPHSRFFFCKVKGEVEEDLKALHFYRLSIYRPGFMLSKEGKKRSGSGGGGGWVHSVSASLLKYLDLPRYGSIYDWELAKVMVSQCFEPKEKDVHIYENKRIHSLAQAK